MRDGRLDRLAGVRYRCAVDRGESIDAELALAIIKQMVRTGALDPAVVAAVRDDADGRDPEMQQAAHVLLVEAMGQTASAFEADYRRRQMVERTARIGRDPNA